MIVWDEGCILTWIDLTPDKISQTYNKLEDTDIEYYSATNYSNTGSNFSLVSLGSGQKDWCLVFDLLNFLWIVPGLPIDGLLSLGV